MNQKRVIIENVQPSVDDGRFPAKRIQGDLVKVTADLFTDGHDALSAVLKFRYGKKRTRWTAVLMEPGVNDQWQSSFSVPELGIYNFSIEAWIDHFKTWRRDLQKRVEADQDVSVDLLIGSQLVAQAGQRASGRRSCRSFCHKLLPLANRSPIPGLKLMRSTTPSGSRV